MHRALDQRRLNFLKRKFFNLKTITGQSINDIFSELTRLQTIIRNIKTSETSTNLNVILIFINSVDDEAYELMKFHLNDMKDFILIHTKERLKSIKQQIKNNLIIDKKINKSESTASKKNDRKCFFCKKKGHFKKKCFK